MTRQCTDLRPCGFESGVDSAEEGGEEDINGRRNENEIKTRKRDDETNCECPRLGLIRADHVETKEDKWRPSAVLFSKNMVV